MIVTHKMTVDLVRPGVVPMIHAMQGDSNSRKVEIALTQNGTLFDIPDGTVAVMRYGKGDGSGGVYSALEDGSPAYSIDGNTVTFCLVPQMFAGYGNVTASVLLVNGDTEIGVFPFRVIVEPDPSVGTVEPEDYIRFGPNGGYYIPTVEQVDESTVHISYTPSKEDMPEVMAEEITLPAGPAGADGRGIQSITRTSGTGAAGTTDIYTITYTDGSKSVFRVYNGKDGTDGADGADGRGIMLTTPEEVVDSDGTVTHQQVFHYTDGTTQTVTVGRDGKDGADGYTPVKGEDYWTDADKAEMVGDVLAALPTWEGGSY